MNISNKDKIVIDALLKLEKRLCNIIHNIVLGKNVDNMFAQYKKLISGEEKFLNRLSVSRDSYNAYLNYLGVQDADRTVSLLTTTGLYTNEVDYSKIRIVSRLYNKFINSSELKYSPSLATLFIDEQVPLLYNILMRDSENKKNTSIAPRLRLLSIFTLADSPAVEKVFLNTPYGDNLPVYDTVRIATDLIVHKKESERREPFPELPVLYAKSKEPYLLSYERVFGMYYKKTLNTVANSIEEVIIKNKNFETDLEFVYLLSYLKSVIATFPENERKVKYQLLSARMGKYYDEKECILILSSIINDIEGTIVPMITRARIHPLETPPNYHR